MAVQRGKRKRRERRRREGEAGPAQMEPAEVVSAPVKPARRMAKPLSERSPITAGLLALICILGAVFTFASFNGKAANEGHIFGAVYLLFAAIEIFVAVRIYRARGGSWR